MTTRLIFFLAALSLALVACGGSGPAKSPGKETSTAWLRALVDDTSDPELIIRPHDAAQDPVFGPVLRRGEREAAASIGNVLVGQTSLKVFEESDLVIVAARHSHPLDAVLVFAGVPASASPEALVDEGGQPLWTKVAARVSGTTEYERVGTGKESSDIRLVAFGRTWIMAVGPAIDRMYGALAIAPPESLEADKGPLFEAVLAGELLDAVKRRSAGDLGPLLNGLLRANVEVEGGKSPAVTIALTYDSDEHATRASDFVKILLAIVDAKKPQFREYLKTITLSRDARKVIVKGPVPARMVQELLRGESAAPAPAAKPGDPGTAL